MCQQGVFPAFLRTKQVKFNRLTVTRGSIIHSAHVLR